ncbi:DUF6624 domain-containing protein [Sphingomonas crusticola]|uniref:DUF6624 domain-containing protein n=1 Tax=Sphingomonas crusticola TaxID=1697973 RepID=UPI0013C2B758|nr:DUF6624 domain-containing protein [Sphingomonas crusticola]
MKAHRWSSALGLFLMLNVATAAASSATGDPPPEIAPFIQAGKYHPGEFEWVRGAYAGASPAERATYLRIARWATDCLQQAQTRLKVDLAERGYPKAAVQSVPVGPLLCRQLAVQPLLGNGKTRIAFATAAARAALVSHGFLTAVALVNSAARVGISTPGEFLTAQTLGEQVLRQATNERFGHGQDALPLTEDERAVVLARVSVAIADQDHENTELLKSIVTQKGWPRISEFGVAGAHAAWLLAQHADADPIFQLDVLKKMEPLISNGEVTKQDYAYLYDRVFLKLTGRQRYGTQTSCSKAMRVPQPLEDPAAVDGLRRGIGLPSEADYLEQMNHMLGSCPPQP